MTSRRFFLCCEGTNAAICLTLTVKMRKAASARQVTEKEETRCMFQTIPPFLSSANPVSIHELRKGAAAAAAACSASVVWFLLFGASPHENGLKPK